MHRERADDRNSGEDGPGGIAPSEEREGWAECEGVRSGMTLFAPVTSLVIVTNNERGTTVRSRVAYIPGSRVT